MIVTICMVKNMQIITHLFNVAITCQLKLRQDILSHSFQLNINYFTPST